MKIHVDHIQEKPLCIPVEESVDSFPLLSQMQRDDGCTFTGPVTGEILACREYGHLRVTGHLRVSVTLACSRCVVPYRTVIAPAFTIIFRKGSPNETADEDEVELAEQDLVSALYSGDEIDMTHEIEEQIVMDIPFKPLCSESCKGLCPACGIDLNHLTCSCGDRDINLKFSALKDFKISV